MTYSIVARDPVTGDFGLGLQSHWFAAASLALFAEPGVGAIASQAEAEPSYGVLGLRLMKEGASAGEALADLLAKDEGSEHR